MDPDQRLRLRSTDVTWQETGDDIVVLDLRTARYLTITTSGVGLWKRLLDGCSAADLARDLGQRYGLDADAAERDVRAFLDRLTSFDLLEA